MRIKLSELIAEYANEINQIADVKANNYLFLINFVSFYGI